MEVIPICNSGHLRKPMIEDLSIFSLIPNIVLPLVVLIQLMVLPSGSSLVKKELLSRLGLIQDLTSCRSTTASLVLVLRGIIYADE
jgi:hypothetical protein